MATKDYISNDAESIKMSYTFLEYIIYPFYKFLLIIWYFPLLLIGACRKKKICIPLTDLPGILTIPAHELVIKIIDQEITSRFVVEAYISKINEVNPIINAIVENRFEEALIEADAVDQKIKTSPLTKTELQKMFPLLGVPITVKESIGVKNMSNTAGYSIVKGRRAPEDAEIIRLCKEAGGIILAVTNTPELCLNWESHNNITGLTRNPYDSRKTAGGSSGGEAAIIGSGGSVIGLGSDIAGSLRLPAHYCGIFSHKPTAHVVSTKGHFPSCKNEQKWNSHFALGPMCRYAGDLLPLMKIITDKQYKTMLNFDQEIDMKKVNIFFAKSYGSILCSSLDSQVNAGLDFLLDYFRFNYGLKIQELDKNILKNTLVPAIHLLVEIEGVEFERPKSGAILEMLKVIFQCSNVSLNTCVYGIIEKYRGFLSESSFAKDNKIIEKLREELETLLGENGVLIMPTFNRPANYHYTTTPKAFDTMNCIFFNALGMPASNCPIGIHSSGLPFGIQVIGKRYNDVLCMTIAKEIEKICGGWRIPQKKFPRVF